MAIRPHVTRANRLAAIDDHLEWAWSLATRRDPQRRKLSYRDDALFAIANALLAIAQCARLAIAERNESE